VAVILAGALLNKRDVSKRQHNGLTTGIDPEQDNCDEVESQVHDFCPRYVQEKTCRLLYCAWHA
jgi:hypothetical protein